MMLRILNWFFSPTKKPIVEEHEDFYTKLLELENRIEELERENVETTNAIYEIANSLETRIDILASDPYKLPLDTNN